MLSPVSATEIDAPVADKPFEGSPITADATSSDTVHGEAGFVADTEARNVTEYVAEAEASDEPGAETSEAHFIDSRPKRARRRPAYLADYMSAAVGGVNVLRCSFNSAVAARAAQLNVMARTKHSARKSVHSMYLLATFDNVARDLPAAYPAPDSTDSELNSLQFSEHVAKPATEATGSVTLQDGGHFSPVSDASTEVKPASRKGGRPKTRRLQCEQCRQTYKHRASVLRHLRKAHGLDAGGQPIRATPQSPPRRPDVQRFYGGKRLPEPASTEGAKFRRVVTAVSLPATNPAESYSVRRLIRSLKREPSATTSSIAARLQSKNAWQADARNTVRSRTLWKKSGRSSLLTSRSGA